MRAFEPSGWRSGAVLGLLALALATCLATPGTLEPLEVTRVEPTAALTGEALEQRKREMQRASRDLAHFGATLASLHLHPQGPNSRFEEFVLLFLDGHVQPLLVGATASEEPSLTTVEAGLRFVAAEVLIEMGERRRAQRAIDEIQRRFEGRASMLVEYPLGEQSTMLDALRALGERESGSRPGRWPEPLPHG